MITVFVAIMSTTLMLVVGLVVDGGAARAARGDALDEAASAARAASQNIDITALHRDHEIVLDEAAARKAVADFMAATGDQATVTIRQDAVATGGTRLRAAPQPAEVTVTVTRTVPSQFLWAAGIDSFTETATATVTPEPGRAP